MKALDNRYFRITMEDGTSRVIRRQRKTNRNDAELCDMVKLANEAFSGEGSVKEVDVVMEEDYLNSLLNRISN